MRFSNFGIMQYYEYWEGSELDLRGVVVDIQNPIQSSLASDSGNYRMLSLAANFQNWLCENDIEIALARYVLPRDGSNEPGRRRYHWAILFQSEEAALLFKMTWA